jgi:hypothetical protein
VIEPVGRPTQPNVTKLVRALRSSPPEMRAAVALCRRNFGGFVSRYFDLTERQQNCARLWTPGQMQVAGNAVAVGLQGKGTIKLEKIPGLRDGNIKVVYATRRSRDGEVVDDVVIFIPAV